MANWYADLEKADGVEVLGLPEKGIVPSDPWPEALWQHVGSRRRLEEPEAQKVKELFQDLEPDSKGRCHFPSWGLAFYEQEALLFAVTICYECDNYYIYSEDGRSLYGFNPNESNAVSLLQHLRGGRSLGDLGRRVRGMLPGNSEKEVASR